MIQAMGNMRMRWLAMAAAVCIASVYGCAGMVKPDVLVQPGDAVMIDYSCYLPDGSLMITTDAAKAIAAEGKKAANKNFMPLREYGPVSATAGDKALNYMLQRDVAEFLEFSVPAYLANGIVNKPYDRRMQISIQGEIPPNIQKNERYTKIKRRRRLPLVFDSGLAVTRQRYGENIGPGDTVDFEVLPGTQLRFGEIKGEWITCNLLFEDGLMIPDPLGHKHLVKIDEKNYWMITENRVGEIVRAGQLIGRVDRIEEEWFWIDWGHPFGGKPLDCDVYVHNLQPDKTRP